MVYITHFADLYHGISKILLLIINTCLLKIEIIMLQPYAIIAMNIECTFAGSVILAIQQ